jgi:CRP/FNR family transcriptional regulator, cyclic AMP receptor protein
VVTGQGYRLVSPVEPRESSTKPSPFVHRGVTRRTVSVLAVDAAELEAIPLFATLSADQRASVAGACEELVVDEGTVLVREGDFGHAVFAIRSGTAEVVQDGAVINRLGPGDYFGEVAVMSGGRRSASVVATSPLRLVTIFNREIWRLERELPEVAAVLREAISARVGTV